MKLEENKFYTSVIGLVIITSSLSLFGELMEPDSALYASISKTMLLKDDWLSLYVQNTDWLDKPHLTFWITALSFKTFGISAFAYKLPSFLLGLLGTWYLYVFAKDIYDKKTALISVLVYITSLHIIISMFDVRAEGYLSTFMLAATYHYYKAHSKSFLHIIAGSFFTACAIMVKGIFILIPILAGFIIYWILTKQYKEFTKSKWWISIVLILLFITPELYALYIQFDIHPEKVVFDKTGVSGLKFFFWDSQFGRFFNTGPIKGKGDISFFLHTNLWAFLPWSILFYSALVYFFKRKNRVGMPSPQIIIWTSATLTFLLFSFSKFQLPHYIIIIFPQFAIITALYLTRLQVKGLKVFFTIQNVLFIIIIVLLSTIALLFRFQYLYLSIAILLAALIVAFLLFRKASLQTIIARNTILALGLISFLYLFFYPSILQYQSGMNAAKWLKQYQPNAKATALLSPNAFAFDFYTSGEVKHIYNYEELKKVKAERNMVIYTPETELEKLKKEYNAKVLKSFDYYRITRLKAKFINYKDRPSVLERFYLVTIN